MENKNPSDTEIKNLIREFQSGKFNSAIKQATSITEKFPNYQFA